MVHDYHWGWDDIQGMMPFERDIYLILLNEWIAKRNEDAKRK